MLDRINLLLQNVDDFKSKHAAEIEEFRIKMLGKKGELNALFDDFKKVSPEEKKELGAKINVLKNAVQEKITSLKAELENSETAEQSDDLSRPGSHDKLGTRHPISLVKNQIEDIFKRLGYTVAEGPGNRGRLACIFRIELCTGASGTRYAGYFFHRKE